MAEQTLIRSVTLIDGTGTGPRPGVDIRIEGSRVVEIGQDLPAGDASVVDATGKFAVPGLIDCHVHLITGAGPGDDARIRKEPLIVIAWDAARNAAASVKGGVTTVRDLGAPGDIAIRLRDEVAAGRMPGPRIRAAGRLICQTGGHLWYIGHEADGEDGVRKAVREELKAGADAIKFIASGGIMTPGVDPRSPQLSVEEISAGVREAHKAFVKVAGHGQGTEGIKNAIRAGVDSIEHGMMLDDEAVALMKERGTFLVPTLSVAQNISKHGTASGLPEYVVQKSDMVREVHRESFRKALAAGVRIAMGTDSGAPFTFHGRSAEEVGLMVAFGMEPMAALVAATRDAADLLNLTEQTGTIEAGKSADLLLLDRDPLADIAALTTPLRVMVRGQWMT